MDGSPDGRGQFACCSRRVLMFRLRAVLRIWARQSRWWNSDSRRDCTLLLRRHVEQAMPAIPGLNHR